MNISSKGNVHKSSFGLCSWAPGPIKGSDAQKQRPQERLATLWFEKRVNLCSNPRFLKKKLKFQLTYGSSNWVSLIAIDFTQSTWFTTSKVNCKNVSEFLSKKFPIDFLSPIDFSQLHMIRPLMCQFAHHNNLSYRSALCNISSNILIQLDFVMQEFSTNLFRLLKGFLIVVLVRFLLLL